MAQLNLPLYGKAVALSSIGDDIVALTSDLHQQKSMVFQFSLKAILGADSQDEREEAITAYRLDGLAKNVLHNRSHSFVVGATVYRIDEAGVHEIKAFSLAPQHSILTQGNQLVLATESNILILSAEGETQQSIDFDAEVTALAGAPAVSSDIFAVGLENGEVHVFENADGGYALKGLLQKYGETEYPTLIHDGAVTQLGIVRYESGDDYIVSFGADLMAMQADTKSLQGFERSSQGLHSGRVTAFVDGPLGRYYTTSTDGTAKSWLKTTDRRQPVTTSIMTIHAAAFVSVEEFNVEQSANERNSYLLVAGGSDVDATLELWSFEEAEPNSEDSSPKGQVDQRVHEIYTAESWIESALSHDEEDVRIATLDKIASWGNRFLGHFVSAAIEDDPSVQEAALNALVEIDSEAVITKLYEILEDDSAETDIRTQAFHHLVDCDNSTGPFESVFSIEDEDLIRAGLEAAIDKAQTNDQIFDLMTSQIGLSDELNKEIVNAQFDARPVTQTLINHVADGDDSLLVQHALNLIHRNGLADQPSARAWLRLSMQHDDLAIRHTATAVRLLESDTLRDFVLFHDLEFHSESLVATLQAVHFSDPDDEFEVPEAAPELSAEDKNILDEIAMSEQEDVSALACTLLTLAGERDTLSALLIFMNSEDIEVRRHAIHGLSLYQDDTASSGLIAAFCNDDSAEIRQKAYETVQIDALLRISQALTSQYEDVRSWGVTDLDSVIGQTGSPSDEALSLLERSLLQCDFENVWRGSFQIYLKNQVSGSEVDTLKYLIRSGNEGVRSLAKEQVIPKVRRHLSESPWSIQAAIEGLKIENDQEARAWFNKLAGLLSSEQDTNALHDVILSALDSKHANVRFAVFDLLAQKPKLDLSSVVIGALLGSEDLESRKRAFSAAQARWQYLRDASDAQNIKDTDASDAFAKQFFSAGINASFDDVKEMILRGFGASTEGWRFEVLQKAINDSNPVIRATACATLLELGGIGFDVAVASQHREVRFRAAQALAKIGDIRALPVLSEFIQITPPDRSAEAYIVNSAFNRAKYDSARQEWRQNMLWALKAGALLESHDLVEALSRLIADQQETLANDRDIQAEAVRAFGWCMDSTSEEERELLFALMSHPHSDVSFAAATALARLGDIRGVDRIWNDLSDVAQFELLIAINDPAYILRAMANNASNARALVLAFTLRAQVLGGSVSYLIDGLTANNAETNLLSAQLLEVIDDQEVLLNRLQVNLNHWSPFKLNDSPSIDLDGPYLGVIEATRAYYSFSRLTPIEKRPIQISLGEWGLTARLFASDDPRTRVRIARAFIRFQSGGLRGLSSEQFLLELARLGQRYLSDAPAKSGLDIDPGQAKVLAFGAYRRLISSTSISNDIRREALYQYCKGLGNGVSQTRLFGLLRQSLSGELGLDAFGHMVRLQDELGLSRARIVDYGLYSEKALNAACGLLVERGSEEEIETYLLGDNEAIAYTLLDLIQERDGLERLENLCEEILDARSYNNSHEVLENCYTQRFAYEKNAIVAALEADETGKYVHNNSDIRRRFADLQPELIERRYGLLAKLVHAQTAGVRETATETLLADYDEQTDKKSARAQQIIAILASVFDKNKQFLRDYNTGLLGIAELVPPLISGLKSTDSGMQDWYISELEAFHKTAQGEGASQAAKDADALIAPALIDRLFNDPSETANRSRILQCLNMLDDRSILPAVLERLEVWGYDHQLYNLAKRLTGYNNPIREWVKWDLISEKEREQYLANQYDDAAFRKILQIDFISEEYYRVSNGINLSKASIHDGKELLTFVKRMLSLPQSNTLNPVRESALSWISWRLENRKSIDSEETRTAYIQALKGALKSKDPKTVFLAAEALSKTDDSSGLRYLEQKAADEKEKDIGLRVRAIQALGRVANIGSLAFLRSMAGFNQYFEALPEEQTRHLLPQLKHASIAALGAMQSSKEAPVIFQMLIDKLHSPNTEEQKAAGQGLGYFKTAEAWETLRNQYAGFMNYRQRSIRECFVDCLKEDSSEQNTEWLLNTLRQECSNDWTMMRKLYGVLKARLPSDNISPDDISFRSGRIAEDTVVENIARYASEISLLEYLRIAVLDHNNSDSYDKLFSALLDTKAQFETWKRTANFPKALVLSAVLEELEAKRYDGVLFARFMAALEENGVRGADYLPMVSQLRQLWSTLRSEQLSGVASDSVDSQLYDIEQHWLTSLRLSGGDGMLEIAEMLVVNGLTSELRSWALSNLKPSAEVTPILLPLLGADDRMLRTTVAALLQSFEVDNVSAVKDDPSALYLLAKKSTAAMLAAAKDGSVSAVQQLSAQGQFDALAELCVDGGDESIVSAALNALGGAATEASHVLLERLQTSLAESDHKYTVQTALRRSAYRRNRQSSFQKRF